MEATGGLVQGGGEEDAGAINVEHHVRYRPQVHELGQKLVVTLETDA